MSKRLVTYSCSCPTSMAPTWIGSLPVAGREAWVPLPRTVMLICEAAAMYEPRRQ